MAKEEIEFLPSGLCTCFIDGSEVRIVKISPEGFSVRTPDKIAAGCDIEMAFYTFKGNRYEEQKITDFTIKSGIKDEFFYIYEFCVLNERYSENASKVIRDYSRYAMMKAYSENSEFSSDMVGYPEAKDYDYYKYYADQKYKWLADEEFGVWNKKELKGIELAVVIDNDDLYGKFLKQDLAEFKRNYFEDNYIDKHPLAEKEIGRIYIGNEFCHNLFPSRELLMKLLNKALGEDIEITICFTYLRQYLLGEISELLDEVYEWCRDNDKKIELIVNDWGFVEMVKGRSDYFSLSLGVLLNKRRKDPRYEYKNGFKESSSLIGENSLNGEEFSALMKECGIERYEYESCGYRAHIAEGTHSLQLPFYVTNTSQYCPLYAMCTTMDRGHQKLVKSCPKYCRDYVFSYPKHLKMVGRYNSIFSFDDSVLRSEDELKYYVESGIDRIVLNFM